MRLGNLLVFILAATSIIACSNEESSGRNKSDSEILTVGSIEKLHPDLDVIVPENATLDILADGHDWSEGPVWVPAIKSLLYSDIPKNAIYRWKDGEKASVWLKPSGYTGSDPRGGESGSNGLILDQNGRLILAQHGDRRLARLEAPWDSPAPNFTTLVAKYQDKRLNSPNDVVMRSNGDFYFTDPPYGLQESGRDSAKELDFQGVYHLTVDGNLSLITDELNRPNGIGLSPDEKILYVVSSDRDQAILMAYDVNEDGSTGNGRVFFETWGDGMCLDQNGNIYQTGPGGVLIINPEGKHLGTLLTTQATSNCTFGEDGSTLFITADRYLLRIRLKSKGIGF